MGRLAAATVAHTAVQVCFELMNIRSSEVVSPWFPVPPI